MRARSVAISYCYYYLLYYYYIIIIMISFCSRVEFVFAFRLASLSRKNSPFVSIRKFVNSAFHRSGEIDLQKTRTTSKDGHAYIMSKFENVLKAQKVKTTFFARFVVILLLLAPMLLSRGVFFSSSFFLLGERARSVRRVSLVSTHFFFYPDGERSDFAHHSLTLSLSFLFSTTHAHKNTHNSFTSSNTNTCT